MPRGPFTLPVPDPRSKSGMFICAYLDEVSKWLTALVRWISEGDSGTGSSSGPVIQMARGPSGSIAAGATATVTLYDGLTLGSTTVTVRNPGPDVVPAGPKRLFLGRISGVDGLAILYWSCVNDA